MSSRKIYLHTNLITFFIKYLCITYLVHFFPKSELPSPKENNYACNDLRCAQCLEVVSCNNMLLILSRDLLGHDGRYTWPTNFLLRSSSIRTSKSLDNSQ